MPTKTELMMIRNLALALEAIFDDLSAVEYDLMEDMADIIDRLSRHYGLPNTTEMSYGDIIDYCEQAIQKAMMDDEA